MALNALVGQTYLLEVASLLSLLEGFVSQWNAAPTLERRLLVEAEVVSTFQRLIDMDFEIDPVVAGSHPELQEFRETYSLYTQLLTMNMAKLRRLGELFLQHFNSQQLILLELLGKLKRIKQKEASLALWSDEKAKFVLADHFLNLDWVDTAFTSLPTADIDSAQGLLTLPVKSLVRVNVRKGRVGSGSNGNPGNSDSAVTTNNINPEFVLNQDPNNWFEYERLDAGPLTLVYTVELGIADIVNHISIQPINVGQTHGFEIEDISFTVSGGGTVSIRDLAGGSISPDFWTVRSLGSDTAWQISFLPIRAQSISFRFVQRFPYKVETLTHDRRQVLRDRYVVAIKDIGIYQKEYRKEGGVNSTPRTLPEGLYAALPFVQVWPPRPLLFDACLEASLDGGETWSESDNVDDGIGSTVLLDGSSLDLLWRLSLSRNDAALDNITDFVEPENPVKEVKTLLHTASRFQSPARISLPESPRGGAVFAFQPRLGRRGSRFGSISLGEGTGNALSLELPFSVIDNSFEPEEMVVYVDREPYSYQEDPAALGAGEWTFSEDFQEIKFSSDLPVNAKVTAVFDEELMLFEEKSDGYYHRMGLLFDPDKENIKIQGLPRTFEKRTLLLPRTKRVIPLQFKNLSSDTFQLTSRNGVTYSEVSTRADVIATSNSYFVDYVNGVLFLNAEFGADSVRAVFEHATPKVLEEEHFSVFFDGLKPAGVRVAKDAFEARAMADVVGAALSKRVNVLSGAYGTRSDVFSSSTNAMTLSEDMIVIGSLYVSDDLVGADNKPEEVPFLDGETEFLGLIPMDTETTVAIEADTGLDYVTFKLAAGGLWYRSYEVLFGDTSVFASYQPTASAAETGSVGDYHVSPSGTVTVNVGTGGILTESVTIRYYYQDPNFEPANKFSVDYRNGVLYSYSDLVDGETVTYKSSSYKAAYNIAQPISGSFYNSGINSVEVRTEGLHKLNNLIKVVWEKAPAASSIRELKPYFSPLIRVLAFRCN